MRKHSVNLFVFVLSFVFVPFAQAQEAKQNERHITVTIMDERGRYSGGLKAESFQIAIDKKVQEIISIKQDVPATIVFLIDLSRSQKGTIMPLLTEIKNIIKTAHPDNEYTFIAFNTKPQLVLDKTQDFAKIEESVNKILETATKGDTAFYDSLYVAIEKADSGRYQKKVLIALSDGIDNASQSYKMGDVTNLLKESDVLFYGVSYARGDINNSISSMQGQATLDNLSWLSGGKSFFAISPTEVSQIFKRIALELKSQYEIGFRIEKFAKSGKWQEIKIKVEPVIEVNKKIKLIARARSGIHSK
jgi:Ca-activated chloride channel family protein